MKYLLSACIALLILVSVDAQKPLYRSVVVAFYNLENLYDTIDEYNVIDEEFTPKGDKRYNSTIYYHKLSNLATVLSSIGTEMNADGPGIIGVAEIENKRVLKDLVATSLLAPKNYQIIHYDSKDARGVDVGLLYNPKYFKPISSAKIFVPLPAGAKEAFYTRDILYVEGILASDTVHVYVNHWPSRRGGEERSAPARETAAMICKKHIELIQRNNSNAKIILMGDLNDDPNSPSIKNVLGAKYKIEKCSINDIYNPWNDFYQKGLGTMAFNDAWGLFDQIMISGSWLNKEQNGFFYHKANIFKRDFMIENMGRYKGYPKRTWDGNIYNGGYSDHFATYIVLLKKAE
jgi:predicted extracellular nuclease